MRTRTARGKPIPPASLSLLRLEFFEAAQRRLPEIGEYLRPYAEREEDPAVLTHVIREWQIRFNLPYSWAYEFAYTTLRMWQRDPEAAQKLKWFVGTSARNSGGVPLPIFRFQIEREFHEGLDFGVYKSSVHGALEAALEDFGRQIGADDLGKKRWPKDLRRAFECLALRISKKLSLAEIAKQPAYSREASTLSRDIKAAANLIGVSLPRPGRPKKNVAR